ncbi:MAG TPA: hypothetical protein VKU00_26670 [Chthonomonadaceae bacterium]|nr:hypothetical protein [Chthonomonadaceae bacterium]
MKKGMIVAGIFLLVLCMRHTFLVSPLKSSQSQDATVRRILDRSEPICDALAPAGASLELAVALVPGTASIRPVWNVQCSDRYGQDLVNVRWNGDTGQLLSAGTQYPLSRGTRIHLTTGLQAKAAARSWLKTLRLMGAAGGWRIACAQYLPAKWIWTVKCVSAGQKARLSLDARSGGLLYVLTDGYTSARP